MGSSIPALPNTDGRLDPSADLFAALVSAPEAFLQPSNALHVAAILAAKQLLDPLATDIADAQTKFRQISRRKRKRDQNDGVARPIQLRQIYTEGFKAKQIWEQSKRILDAALDQIDTDIEELEQTLGEQILPKPKESGAREDIDGEDDRYGSENFSEMSIGESAADFGDEVSGLDDAEEIAGEDHDLEDEEDIEDIEEGEDEDESSDLDSTRQPETYITDPNGLNDGFFSIDNFNTQTSFLEQQDALGQDDNPSDEDEIDWDANPLAGPPDTEPRAQAKLNKADDPAESDEEGPTFGDADLDDVDDNDDNDENENDEMTMSMTNANDLMYKDFFEPPPRKRSKTTRMRALPKTQPGPQMNHGNDDDDDEIEDNIQRAISDVRRDLLDSEEDRSLSENDDDNDAKPKSALSKKTLNLSTHEKQRAAIATEIRRLEALAVSKRSWQLSGEARAPDRPLNSLIEEDLEFERTGKPVPVITAQVTEDIEALIKRRILARDFDEVVRRRPDASGLLAASSRRGLTDHLPTGAIAVDDSKPQSGLAAVYEEAHLARSDPNYVDPRDKQTKRRHDAIARLWKETAYQLDLLSNLHFKPRRVEIDVTTVEDKPVIAMEDARPVGGEGGVGERSRLAPQEVWRVGGKTTGAGEVLRANVSVSREEMGRDEKRRRRRREKERAKKARGNRPLVNGGTWKGEAMLRGGESGGKGKGKGDEKEDIISQLKRGGVKVIGKKGDVLDLGGRGRTQSSGLGEAGRNAVSVSALKL